MKSRIVKVSLWYDDDFTASSKNTKFLFLYLLTCPFIEMTGIFKFPRHHILLETGLTEDELNKSIIELEAIKKAFLYKNWIYVPNTEKHNKYSLGSKTGKGFQIEMKNIPKDIFTYFNKRYPYHTPMIDSEDRRQKTEDRIYKTEIRNQSDRIFDALSEKGDNND